jgi:hypothetical protein
MTEQNETKEHVHFREDDIARKEGKEHIDYPKTPAACRQKEHHVTFTGDDIARKAGKEHIDYPKTYAADDSQNDARVRFTGDAIARKAGKEHVDNPKTKYKSTKRSGQVVQEEEFEHPAKVKVSKEDFFMHLKIFGFIILFFFGKMIYDNMRGSSGPKPPPVIPKKGLMEKMQENALKELELVDPDLPQNNLIQFPSRNSTHGDGGSGNDKKSSIACSIYLTGSSIPATGMNFGVFATKPFQEGDVIFHSGKTLIVEGMELSVHAMLMKQHPLFGNVKWTKQNGIIAKRDIKAGEEMFIDFSDFKDPDSFANIYHNTLHVNDPLKEDYEMADSIVSDVIDAIPHKLVFDKPKRKQYKQKFNRGDGKLVPEVDAGRILTIIKNTVSKYSNKLGRLIPDTTIKARSINEAKGTARFISNRRSVKWITRHGICLNGLSSESSCSAKQAMMIAEGSNGAFTTRSVSAGEIIETVPLYAMKRNDSPGDGNCIAAPVEDVVLCPLSSASNARKGEQCKSGVDECPSNMINAKYEWSEWNAANRALKDITAEEFLKVRGLFSFANTSRDNEWGRLICLTLVYFYRNL